MKQVYVDALGGKVSSVGFGCASLGGRIGVREGLRALERAYEAGITWYDVAPSYGDAMAESIWGQFASKKRDTVQVCTKVGMRPGNTSSLMRILKPISRIAIQTFPALRSQVSRVRPQPFRVPLSGEMITASIEQSLRRLRTDYVDVLALHRPAIEEVVREDIILALERIVKDGKARAISIAGDLEAAMKGLNDSLPYRLVQTANTPLEPNLEKLKDRDSSARTIVTYGTFSCLDQLVGRIGGQKEILSAFRELGYQGNLTEIASSFLADYAFATNSAGVTLFSMFNKEHLDFNLRRLKSHPALSSLNSIVALLSVEAGRPAQGRA